MNLVLTDARGGHLSLTTQIESLRFDCIACSAHHDGFTVLNSLVADRMDRSALESACDEVNDSRSVVALPASARSHSRVVIMPVVRASGLEGRIEAAQLMLDLFAVSQEKDVQATSLLITQFLQVRTYPRAHILGVLEGLQRIGLRSFLGLTTLGFDISALREAEFRKDAFQIFGV